MHLKVSVDWVLGLLGDSNCHYLIGDYLTPVG